MAFEYGFYNSDKLSEGKRRKYDAHDFSRFFEGIITDGYLLTEYTNHGEVTETVDGTTTTTTKYYPFQVVPVTTEPLQVMVYPGKAWFNGTWNISESPFALNLADFDDCYPDTTYNRVVFVLLEVDLSEKTNRIFCFGGTPKVGSTYDTDIRNYPEYPNNSGLDKYWYQIAAIMLPGGAASDYHLTNSSVTYNYANMKLCTSVLQQTDITGLFTEWQGQWQDWLSQKDTEYSTYLSNKTTDFEAWVNNLRTVLNESAAGHLESLIQAEATQRAADDDAIINAFLDMIPDNYVVSIPV